MYVLQAGSAVSPNLTFPGVIFHESGAFEDLQAYKRDVATDVRPPDSAELLVRSSEFGSRREETLRNILIKALRLALSHGNSRPSRP